ncbi:putative reverse transcriptase, RNA-dependent DNA polymerase [Tanacetum coccineum]
MLVQGLIFQGEGSTVPVESHHTPTGAPSTSQPHLSPTLRSSIRQETEVLQPNSPPHTNVADEAASTGQGSGNIDKTPTIPYDSPLPRVHTLGSDEGRMQHNELMDLVTKLSDKVVALETDLTQTKKVYGAAFTRLIKKVKRLEKKDKLSKSRRKLRLVLLDKEGSDSDFLAQEDPSKQGRKIAQLDEDEGITLVQMGVSTASKDYTIFQTNVPVTTAGAEISIASPEVKIVEQERLGLETAVRLQEEFDEEERQRIARVHEAARSFSKVEWEDIRARVEASEEAAEEELGQQSSKKQKSDELSQEELQQLMIIVPEEGMNIEALQTKYPIIDWEVYTEDSRMYWDNHRVIKSYRCISDSEFSSVGSAGMGYFSPPGLQFHWAWIRALRVSDLQKLMDLQSLMSNYKLSSPDQDRRECVIDNTRSFTISGVKFLITYSPSPLSTYPYTWKKLVPIKVNVLSWRIKNNMTPTRVNLDNRGIDLYLTRCLVCDNELETEVQSL